MLWDLDAHRVSLPTNKRLKFLRRVEDFLLSFEKHRCQLRDVERIHGSLCYISFIYQSGRNRPPSLSNFATSFHGDEFIARYPSRSLITDLKWWRVELQKADFYRQLTPRGVPIDLGIFVDASTSWGIGIVIQKKWLAFRLAPSWKIKEAIGIRESTILIRSDNKGTIGSLDKGRSPNIHINLSIRRIYTVLRPNFITLSFLYVPSEDNLADPFSRENWVFPKISLTF